MRFQNVKLKFAPKRLKFFKSLQVRILIVIFIYLFVPVALLLNYNFAQMESVLQENTSKLVLGNLEQIGNKIDIATEDIMKISSMVSSNSVITAGLSGYNCNNISEFAIKDILYFSADDVIKISELQKQIYYVKNNFYDYDTHVILFGADGIMYSSVEDLYDELQFKTKYYKIYKDQDWYETLKNGGKAGIWTAPFSYEIDTDAKHYISLSRIIKDNYTQNILGIIMVNFSEDNFNRYIGSNVNGIVTLLNDRKQAIFSTGEIENRQFSDRIYTQLPENGKGFFSSDIDGKKFLVNYYSVGKIAWSLVSLMPYDDVMKDITKLKKATFTINFVLFIAFFIIAFILILHLTYPLKKLIWKIRTMKIGDHIIGLKDVEYSDDVSRLVNSFEYMIKRVEELVQTVIEEQRYENELKYDTLRAQINPHFLFNTLNTIKWSAMMSGSENVSRMITALGKLLEVSMNKGEDEINLKEELQLTASYVYIENIKNNGSLKLTYEVDEDFGSLKILKLILQPIVENSIIHGFKNRTADNVINIEAKIDGNKLIVSVKDNGAGISKEKIDQILYSGQQHGKHKYSSIGLINIHERLRIKYGNEYGLRIESEENNGTCVSVLLPIIKGDSTT